MRILTFIDNLLKSVKFGVFLMLLIGLASIYGTIFPAKTPFDLNVYKTLPFISLLFLFALNTAYCTLFRLIKQLKAKQNFSSTTGGKALITISEAESNTLLDRLQKSGFKNFTKDNNIYAFKGANRIYVILAIHIAIVLLLITTGLSSLTGFLGTANVYVNDKLSQCFDWELKKDVPLPFDIVVDAAKIVYYPMPIKVLVKDNITSQSQLFTMREEDVISFAGERFKITEADPITGKLKVFLLKDGKQVGSFENAVSFEKLNLKFTLKAYIDPIPKQYIADIAIFENRIEKASKRVSINDPLVYKGYRIFLMNIARDEYNFDYVGFQITKEPFMPFIWLSSIMLCVSLIFYPFIREIRYRIEKQENCFTVYALYPAEYSQKYLSNLLKGTNIHIDN